MTASVHTTLISVSELRALLQSSAPPVLIDCSFDLADPAKGEKKYQQGHLPGAFYAHLDRDLSGPLHPGGPRSPLFTGRHPLPDREALRAWAGRLGIAPGRQVVTFDAEGSPFAARAWWLLRWLGHEAVAARRWNGCMAICRRRLGHRGCPTARWPSLPGPGPA